MIDEWGLTMLIVSIMVRICKVALKLLVVCIHFLVIYQKKKIYLGIFIDGHTIVKVEPLCTEYFTMSL